MFQDIQLKGDDIWLKDLNLQYSPLQLDWEYNYDSVPQITLSESTPQPTYDLNISLPNLLKEEGFKIKVTSGYRKGAKTSNGHDSNHSKGDEQSPGAYDIVPLDRNFDKFKKELYSNPRVVNWLQLHGWGILEETTPEVMRKTRATGKHFHFGPDKLALQMSYNNGIRYAQEGAKLLIQQAKYEPIDISQIFNKDNVDNLMNAIKESDYFNIPEPELEEEPEPDNNLYYGYPEFIKNLEKAIEQDPLVAQYANLLTKTAKRESSFKSDAKNPESSAYGYFQFIKANQKKYPIYNKGAVGQIIAAAHMMQDIFNNPNAQILLNKGYNPMQVITLGWWRPASLKEVVETPNKDVSIGGLSTQKILRMYA